MNKIKYFLTCRNKASSPYICNLIRRLSSKSTEKIIEDSYKVLNIPKNSDQNTVHAAYLELAKKYHPDSGSPEANKEKFVTLENAFRILTKHNTGSSTEEVEKIVYDIRHTAPQHRQYLSYEGVGHGTPSQREKQWIQHRAQKAAENLLEHRMAKSMATENALMKKGEYGKKHDIKTKYGYERLVEDLIQESMSKGEFDNLSGKGKPLKDKNTNPYVDFTTHKLNEVLINNGFTPEWITMCKEIEQDIQFLKRDIGNDRMYLGPCPLSPADAAKWEEICEENRYYAQTINSKINKFNLIVPLINKQKFLVEYDKLCEDILKNGEHSKPKPSYSDIEIKKLGLASEEDFFHVIFKSFSDIFTLNKKNNVDK